MLQIKVNEYVKIIRVTPKLAVKQDVRDKYIGEIGRVSAVIQRRKLVLVTFDDECQIYFKDDEVTNA